MAVATSASEMPGATMASVACCTFPRPEKALMMPQTVPNSPTYGLVLPTVASVARLCSSRSISLQLRHAHRARAPSEQLLGGAAPLWRSRANSRNPNSKMPPCRVAPPADSIGAVQLRQIVPGPEALSKRPPRAARARDQRRLREDDRPGPEEAQQQHAR